jgi:hypothetical protein
VSWNPSAGVGLRPGSRAETLKFCFNPVTLAAISSLLLSLGCASPNETPEELATTEAKPPAIPAAVYRRAEVDRSSQLQAEVDRLRADLAQAEEALLLAESGLRGNHTRADAVSSLAEARIHVERAAIDAPWREAAISEARRKLEEADRQIEQSHFGAALFFVHRAKRIADGIQAENELADQRPGTLYIRSELVNLRAGPSTRDVVVRTLPMGSPVFPERTLNHWFLVRDNAGSVGWIHRNLLSSERLTPRFEADQPVPGSLEPN